MFKSTFDTIFCPPVNSSGDVYHIAAYLILCRALKNTVPKVVLFCDTEDTKTQALRSKSFLRALGFIQVQVEEFNRTSAQPPVRLANSIQEVQRFSEDAVDQKLTTSMISYAQLRYGKFVTDVIARHILQRSFSAKAVAAHTWADEQVQSAIKALGLNKNPFVILNLRYSKNANSGQNVTTQELKTISKSLAAQGCRLIIIDVGGQQGREFVTKYNSNDYAQAKCISGFPRLEDLHADYQKFPHLLLFLQFARLPNFRGVIGNTSGTLDIAAFMGIKTLCIHRFKVTSNRNVIVPNQDLRVLLLANLMSVCDYAVGLEKLARIIVLWLTSERHLLCHNLSQAQKVTLEANRFMQNHYERRCFAIDGKGKVANKVFAPQYTQVKLDQKLSASLFAKLAQTSITSLVLSADAAHAKDDAAIEKPIYTRTRSASSPGLS